ncbi:hypothetical protein B296_00029517, partial [Ensete ventricosum]
YRDEVRMMRLGTCLKCVGSLPGWCKRVRQKKTETRWKIIGDLEKEELEMHSRADPAEACSRRRAASRDRDKKPPNPNRHRIPHPKANLLIPMAEAQKEQILPGDPSHDVGSLLLDSSPSAPQPAAVPLTLEERFALVRSVGEECIQEEELMNLLAKKPVPVCYDGFEPSGRMHIAQLTSAGCTVKIWIADWFAQLNNKMGGDLKKIHTVDMLPGLQEGQEKMSKSDPSSSIYMEDEE